MIIILVAGTGIALTGWYFFIEADRNADIKTPVLPQNCYSVNGQQICPKK
jgi:hypothetical protein